MGVIIGMDPHKRSATIEVIDERARVQDRRGAERRVGASPRSRATTASSAHR
jgi:hypothetical protein